MKKRLVFICILLPLLVLVISLLARRSGTPESTVSAVGGPAASFVPAATVINPAADTASSLPSETPPAPPAEPNPGTSAIHSGNSMPDAAARTVENTGRDTVKPQPRDKALESALTALDNDTAPALYAAAPKASTEDFLEQSEAQLAREDTTLRKNEVLQEKIVDPEEKKAVETWQTQEIQRREAVQEKDFAEYVSALENQVVGSWKMGRTATVTFFKDGTGETKSLKEESKEETLLSNFYFRYTMNGNILKIIPILTAGSKRRITCHFVVKKTDQELIIGPYRYREQ